MKNQPSSPAIPPAKPKSDIKDSPPGKAAPVVETGGPAGPEPTRYGDWEKNGRCVDF